MTAVRLEWKYEKGAWVEKEVDPQTCTVGSQAEPVSCTFETSIGGEYRISATIQDSMGRENYSEFTRWVSGGQRPPARNVAARRGHPHSRQGNIPARRRGRDSSAIPLCAGGRTALTAPQWHRLDRAIHHGWLHVHPARAHPGRTDSQPAHQRRPRRFSARVSTTTARPGMICPARPAYASGSLTLDIPPLSQRIVAHCGAGCDGTAAGRRNHA